MPDLVAQGSRAEQRWRRTLVAEEAFELGRVADASATWDDRISRQHASILWNGRELTVRRLPNARNAIFFHGRECDEFCIQPGEHFVIGTTTFLLMDDPVEVAAETPAPVAERAYAADELKQLRFRNPDDRIEVLSRLPDTIRGAPSDYDLFVRFVNVLLVGVPHAAAAALVHLEGTDPASSPVKVLYWDRRRLSGDAFSPSERLIRRSLADRKSVVHVWSTGSRKDATYTQTGDADWAFCTPILGDGSRGWAAYVSGRFTSDTPLSGSGGDPLDLRDDLKFTEIAAATLGSLRDVRVLERRQANLRQFFSPVVLEALADNDDDETLAPRETDVAVLFCDLRGFSRKSEELADDLLGLLHRVSDALSVMTRRIFEEGGVVGDFHGDAAMGFWGWPFSQPDAVTRACRAALKIRQEFFDAAAQPGHPLADFRMGIGIAAGKAVAGKIGSADQVKVTVFGHVVNLASRLQELTKHLRAPILMDEGTARFVRQNVPTEMMRVRRVARVKPAGMTAPVEVAELLPPQSDYPQLLDEHIQAYENALDALVARNWTSAFRLLHQVPADDRVKDFLTVFIAQNNRTPPEHWDGVIPSPAK